MDTNKSQVHNKKYIQDGTRSRVGARLNLEFFLISGQESYNKDKPELPRKVEFAGNKKFKEKSYAKQENT